MDKQGIIFDISHYMLEDGPGIRTNVFFKGCPLRCMWCSNVFGLEKGFQLSFEQERCTGCRACVSVCPVGAAGWDDAIKKSTTDFSACRPHDYNSCNSKAAFSCNFECTDICPAKARKKTGKIVTASEVFREIEKDRAFYRRGEGGVTLSGGEVLMQPEFALDILKRCQSAGINTAIETCGYGNSTAFSEIIEYCDTVFTDCKCMDAKKHKELTQADNAIILENIKMAAEKCHDMKTRLIVRLPLIPSLNDDEENITETADFVKKLRGNVLLNVLPYHNYGAAKYAYAGRKYKLDELKPQTKSKMDNVRKILKKTGVSCSIGGYDI